LATQPFLRQRIAEDGDFESLVHLVRGAMPGAYEQLLRDLDDVFSEQEANFQCCSPSNGGMDASELVV